MAVDRATGAAAKNQPARHYGGPRTISALVPALTRPAFRKQSPAAAQLIADWPLIVGPVLNEATMPRRFAAGTLTVGCAGPVALELQHLAGQLIDRINGHLGQTLVQRLRFVQEAPRRVEAPRRRNPDTPAIAIPDFPDGPLRDALSALGGAVRSDRT